jgi:hypothetical protein
MTTPRKVDGTPGCGWHNETQSCGEEVGEGSITHLPARERHEWRGQQLRVKSDKRPIQIESDQVGLIGVIHRQMAIRRHRSSLSIFVHLAIFLFFKVPFIFFKAVGANHALDVKHKPQIRHHLFIERWPGSILVDGARTRTQSTKLEESLGGND